MFSFTSNRKSSFKAIDHGLRFSPLLELLDERCLPANPVVPVSSRPAAPMWDPTNDHDTVHYGNDHGKVNIPATYPRD